MSETITVQTIRGINVGRCRIMMPVTITAIKAAEKRGVEKFYYRCHGSEEAKGDPFAIDIESNPTLKALYLDAEADSGYIRDRSVPELPR